MRNTLVKLATVVATAATVSVPALAIEQGRAGGATITRVDLQQKVQARFAALDANRDGSVTRAEYDAQRAKLKGERRERRFASLDTDRNGQVSREEFLAQADTRGRGRDMGGHAGRGRGMAAIGGFAMMDANKDGHVTLAEASARPLAAFDAADANKDGSLTPEERRAARIDAHDRRADRRG